MKILVVDDNWLVLNALRRVLSVRRFQVSLVDQAQTAIRMAFTGGFDLIITDLYLPDMEGMEMIAAMRGLLAKTPIIIMSTDHDAEAIARISKAKFLAKPATNEALWAAIADAVPA